MIKRFGFAVALVTLMGFAGVTTASATPVVPCTSTGFIRDGINMTAALINPAGRVSGDINATECNIGVYYDHGSGTVEAANIHSANYFGVVNGGTNTVKVNVTNDTIHDIGEMPLNGTQHGVAVYYIAYGTGKASGSIIGNTISTYQKGGIVANGVGTNVEIDLNTVTGQGPVNYIAQNGIQIAYGAKAVVRSNRVTDNSYTGSSTDASGILVIGGPYFGTCPPDTGPPCPYTTKTQIAYNTLLNNDVGVNIFNADADGNAPPTPTNITVDSNTIRNPAVTNGYIYQAGISDFGNNDRLVNNTISGAGYDPNTLPGSTFAIDTTGSTHPRVHGNATP